MVAHYNFKTRVGAAIDRFDLSIYKALVGDVTYCSGFCNLYGTPVGAPESWQYPILRQFMPIVDFYSASVGTPTLYRVPMLQQFLTPVDFNSAS